MNDSLSLGQPTPAPARRPAVLAAALLSIELIAAMQIYLTATVMPLIAGELSGRQLYGVATGAPLVANFITLPLGAALMRRHSPAALLTWLTPVTVLGGVVAAVSPTMWWFIAGRVITGLASGALAGVAMGAVVTGMPTSWRRIVLALYNVIWVVASLIGPGYAALVSHALSWRWALVLYLPLLLIARLVVARQLPPADPSTQRQPLPLVQAFALAAGVGLLVLVPLRSWLAVVSVAFGLALVVWSARRLLPAPVLRMRRGAASSMVLLAVVVAAWFGADAVIAIIGHDRLAMGTGMVGVLVGAGGLGWSLSGLLCGFWALHGRALKVRLVVGYLMLAAGLLGMAWAAQRLDQLGLVATWSLASLGMGLVYLDVMNRSFEPDPVDPILPTDAASAVVLAEQVPTAVVMSLAASWIAARPDGSPVLFVALAAVALLGLLLVSRLGTGATPTDRSAASAS